MKPVTLKIQQYLRDGGTPESLNAELAIIPHHHATLPLVGFTYHHLDSPKTNDIVREARGIVLEKDSWNLVAKSFNRFFNLGELEEEYRTFNWSNFDCYNKADGSLMLLFYYNGMWHVKTRGSFGDAIVQNPLPHYSPSFSSLFWDILNAKLDSKNQLNAVNRIFDHNCTYVFEMCSIYNKVVRLYQKPTLYLLTIVNNQTAQEYPHKITDEFAIKHGLDRVERFHCNSRNEIQSLIKEKENTDPTWEGVVICDNKWLRYKLKTSTYLSLHYLLGNGNLLNPKRLIPFALKEDPDELLLYFPEAKEHLYAVKQKLDEAYCKLRGVWQKYHTIASQKEFALAIKGKTPFAGLLFQLRKQSGTPGAGGFLPGAQTEEQLQEIWRENSDMLAKIIFDNNN